PAQYCKAVLSGNKSDDDDEKSRASKSSKSSKSAGSSKGTKNQIGQLKSQLKKSFAQYKEMKEQVEELENESLTGSEDDKDGYNSFNLNDNVASCFMNGPDLMNGWLLDNQSTDDIACNEALVQPGSIRKSENTLQLHTQAGVLKVNQKAKIIGYPYDVWFSRKGKANILSFKHVKRAQLPISYHDDKNTFVVHREHLNQPNWEFKMHPCGLHYYQPPANGMVHLNVVSENKRMFTKRQIKDAEKAVALRAKLGYPSDKDLHWILRAKLISNCEVKEQDLDVAQKIWGKSVPALKGKTVRKQPAPVVTDLVDVPREFIKLHRDLPLCFDIFFVNKVPMLITLGLKIYYTTITHLKNRQVKTIYAALKQVYVFYYRCGYRIVEFRMDREFDALLPIIGQMAGSPRANLTSSNEHVPEIECRIRVVKERCRATRH
ncbi:MAG: hypothetical protein ACRCZI_06320, partial [Cetobacterium sp.]